MAGEVSQRSIGAMSRILPFFFNGRSDVRETLYENGFPDWFVRRSQQYAGQWLEILMDLRKGTFFYPPNNAYVEEYETIEGVTDDPRWDGDLASFGEFYIQKLAAFASTLGALSRGRITVTSEPLLRSLQLDGFDVDKANLRLVPLEGPVSAQAEEDHLTRLVKDSGVPEGYIVLKHIQDASSLYTEGKYNSSLGESRNIIQALVDGISTATDAQGKQSTNLPGGTAPRIGYLKDVEFLTADEQAAFKSAWGSLSAGSHPGVPEREQARIGLILALEFGQLLLIKFENWKTNDYQKFS
jgi:hypothetical protein